MKITKSKLREMIRHSLDELAIQKVFKLSNDLEVDVMDDGSAVMRTKQGVVNLSPKNYKILSRRIKQGKMESVNEARLNDIVQDIIFTAAQYTSKKLDHIAKQSWDSSDELMKQIMQNIPMSKWNPFQRDVKKLLKKHSIREETLNEKKWDISQKTQGGTDFRNTMAFHSRELQKVVSIYKNRHKVDKEEMKYYMNIWIKGFHKRLKDLGVL